MLNKKTVVLRHLLIWSLYITYELLLIEISVGLTTTAFHLFLYYLLNISLFYFNAHVILDYAFFKTAQPYLVAMGLILVEVMIFLLLKLELDALLNRKGHLNLVFNVHNERLWLTNVFREIFFIGFSIAYWSMLYLVKFKEKNHQMETEQLKTFATTLELENKYMSVENAYLQNQISPHLLFNSLNFIYNKVYKESAEAGKSVALLAELMRYSLVSANDSRTVLLSEEVTQLENLVALCQMRFRNQFYLRFKKKGKLSAVEIIPLILITLVENMMKHGDLGDQKHPALIAIELSGDQLHFETRNKIRHTNLYPKNGLGLKNIDKRLNNYYPGRYTFVTGTHQDIFTTQLTLHL